jgi:hypothetical protein
MTKSFGCFGIGIMCHSGVTCLTHKLLLSLSCDTIKNNQLSVLVYYKAEVSENVHVTLNNNHSLIRNITPYLFIIWIIVALRSVAFFVTDFEQYNWSTKCFQNRIFSAVVTFQMHVRVSCNGKIRNVAADLNNIDMSMYLKIPKW